VAGSAAYRTADGTEGSTVTVTSSASRPACARAWRISGAEDVATAAPSVTITTNEGNVTDHTPPAFSGTSNDYLYLLPIHFDTIITINTFPSGYGNTGKLQSFTSGAQTGLGYCDKSTTASSSETPGNYVFSATRRAIPTTVAITPAGASTTSTLTGTITASVTESDIVTGGKTLIITITGDTWKAAGTGPIGSTADTQALIDGFDAASSPTNGWNNEVRDKALTSEVVRTSDTVATWTIAAQSGYDITSQEVITGTIPTDVLVTGAGAITATPTFTIDQVAAGSLLLLNRSIANYGGIRQ